MRRIIFKPVYTCYRPW